MTPLLASVTSVDKIPDRDERKCNSLVLLARRLPAFHRRTLREEKRKHEGKRNSQEYETVVRMQREKIQSGRKGIRGSKVRVGCECCIGRRGPD